MDTIFPQPLEHPLRSLLWRCGGFYDCPVDPAGTWKGPLVGFVGRYTDEIGNETQYVGPTYCNFAKAERHGPVLQHIAQELYRRIKFGYPELFEKAAGFVGTPEGGKKLATALELLTGKQGIYPDERVIAHATSMSRARKEFVFDRHQPDGGLWIVVEDVANNFSSTEKNIRLIEADGSEVGAIMCFLNRSQRVRKDFWTSDGRKIPIIALIEESMPQYRQDDPVVTEHIKRGGVIVLDPKKQWSRLMDAMTELVPA